MQAGRPIKIRVTVVIYEMWRGKVQKHVGTGRIITCFLNEMNRNIIFTFDKSYFSNSYLRLINAPYCILSICSFFHYLNVTFHGFQSVLSEKISGKSSLKPHTLIVPNTYVNGTHFLACKMSKHIPLSTHLAHI